MIVRPGDLWDYYARDLTIVVPTNGFVKKDGSCVMGRGVALQAVKHFPEVKYELGSLIKEHGNNVNVLSNGLIAFPVKDNWWEPAKLKLIEQSAIQLRSLIVLEDWGMVYMPKVGCGNGRQRWEDVEPILDKYLSDYAIVIDNAIKGY